MRESEKCERCGKPLPVGGLLGSCPKCLLEAGLETMYNASPTQSFPARVGPYTLRSLLGEGGMGEVYLAEQHEPIRRRVALKIIKRGMDTSHVIARFESERQALALMSHPNIARVLDAGEDQGRPYFVMEYVAGLPVTDYCDRHRLKTRERLRLFATICEAIQHAHQKGVIHRDIKPSNVLVALQDRQAVPKVIDFGVAKATQQRLTERTLFTQHGLMLGTPEYMSPEQAEMTGLDVDTRTDVYSLGVLLYELLTGILPFDAKMLREAGYDEIRRIIREEEPEKPTTRLKRLGETGHDIARRRHTDLKSLSREIRGDLEWIILKALDKDRTRRYASASELGADVERHMQNDPVVAGPPSQLYRLGKIAAKHRGAVVSVASVVLTLVLMGSLALRLGLEAQRNAAQVQTHAILTAAASAEDPLLGTLLLGELGRSGGSLESVEVARRRLEQPIPVAVFRGHEAPVPWGRFSQDGRRFVSSSLDGTARVWNTDGTGDVVVLPNYPFGPAAIDRQGLQAATHTDSGLVITRLDSPRSLLLPAPAPRFLNRFIEPDDPLTVFSDDGMWVATVSDHLRAWSTDGIGDEFEAAGSGSSGFSVRASVLGMGPIVGLSPDGSLAATADRFGSGDVMVWFTDGSAPAITLRGHTKPIAVLRFSSSGKALASVDEGGEVRVWRPLESGGPLLIKHSRRTVVDLRFSPDGSYLLTPAVDGTVDLSPLNGGATIKLDGGGYPLHARFDADGQRILTLAGGDPLDWVSDLPPGARVLQTSIVRIYRVDGTLEWEVRSGFEGRVLDVVFNREGAFAISAVDEDQSIRLWRVDVEREPTFGHHVGVVNSAAFDSSGRRIVTAGNDGAVRVWSTEPGGEPEILRHDTPVRSAVFSPDDRRILTVTVDGTVSLWRSDGNGEPVRLASAIGLEPYYLPRADFSADGTKVLTYAIFKQSRELVLPSTGFFKRRFVLPPPPPAPKVQRSDGAGPVVTLSGHEGEIAMATFSPDGNRVATASHDHTARIWWLEESRDALVLQHEEPVLAVAFSPDGTQLATLTEDGSVRLWRPNEPSETRILGSVALSGSYQTKSLVFNPNGRLVALVGAEDGALYLWLTEGNREPRVLRGSEGEITEVSFSADGNSMLTLASGRLMFGFVDDNEDVPFPGVGGVRVWRSDGSGTSLLLRKFGFSEREQEFGIASAAFSPDGKQVVTAHADGSARISYTEWEDLTDVLRSSTTACLSAEQRMQYLAEPSDTALDAFSACETRHGRAP